jgi:hypothetical protein
MKPIHPLLEKYKTTDLLPVLAMLLVSGMILDSEKETTVTWHDKTHPAIKFVFRQGFHNRLRLIVSKPVYRVYLEKEKKAACQARTINDLSRFLAYYLMKGI